MKTMAKNRMSGFLNDLDKFNFDDEEDGDNASSSIPSPPKRFDSNNSRVSTESSSKMTNATTLSQRTGSFDMSTVTFQNGAQNIVDALNQKQTSTSSRRYRKYASHNSSNSFNESTDTMLLQLMVQEALLDSSKFKHQDTEYVQEIKGKLTKLVTQAGSIYNKLTLEQKIRETAQSLTKLSSNNPSQAKSNLENLNQANVKVESIAGQLMDTTSQIIMLERTLLQHTCSVLAHELENNRKASAGENGRANGRASPERSLSRKLETAENRLREQGKVIQSLRSGEVASKQDARKSKSTEAPTAAEYNRLKLDLATTRSELQQVREDFRAEKDKVEQLQLTLEDESTSLLEAKDRTISNLLSEIEEMNTQLEMRDSTGEITNLRTRVRELEGGTGQGSANSDDMKSLSAERDRLKNLLVAEEERTRMLEDQLEKSGAGSGRISSTNLSPPQSNNFGSDTETEDESYSRPNAARKKLQVPRQRANIPSNSSGNDQTHKETVSELQMQIDEFKQTESDLAGVQQELLNLSRPVPFNPERFISLVRDKIKQLEDLSADAGRGGENDEQIYEMQQEIQELDQKRREIEQDYQDLEDRMNTDIDKLKESHQSQIDSLKTTHKNEIESATNIQKKQMESISQLSTAEIASLKEKLRKSEDSYQQIKRERDSKPDPVKLLEKLKVSESKNDTQVKEIATLSKKCRELEGQVQDLVNAMEESMTGPKPKEATPESALLAEIESLQMQVISLKTEKVELLENQDNEQHRVEMLQEETVTLKTELERLTASLKEFASQQEKYETTISQLKQDIKKLQAEGSEGSASGEGDKPAAGGSGGWFGFLSSSTSSDNLKTQS